MDLGDWIRQAVADPAAAAGRPVMLDGRPLEVTEVLRWLPGRRAVLRGSWGERSVVVKLYRDVRGVREGRREHRRLQALAARQVAAPMPLALEVTAEAGILVLEALEGPLAAELLAQAPDREARVTLIRSLCHWVQEQGKRGVLQDDIHLSNFLQQAGQWHLLDAAGCRLDVTRARERQVNLAWLLAQFDPVDAHLARQGLTLQDMPPDPLLRRVQRARYRMLMKKAERDCTEYRRLRIAGLRGMVRREHEDAILALVKQGLDAVMADAVMLKDGGSATVVLLPGPGWVIKRYNLKHRLQAVKRQFGRTRARNSWRAGNVLRAMGVRTPLPLAFVESHRGGMTGVCWFISALDEGEGLDRHDPDTPLPARQARALQELFWVLARFRCSHGDMKASNLMVNEDRVGLIDLDAWQWHGRAGAAARALERDRRRLLANWDSAAPVRRQVESLLQERELA